MLAELTDATRSDLLEFFSSTAAMEMHRENRPEIHAMNVSSAGVRLLSTLPKSNPAVPDIAHTVAMSAVCLVNAGDRATASQVLAYVLENFDDSFEEPDKELFWRAKLKTFV